MLTFKKKVVYIKWSCACKKGIVTMLEAQESNPLVTVLFLTLSLTKGLKQTN